MKKYTYSVQYFETADQQAPHCEDYPTLPDAMRAFSAHVAAGHHVLVSAGSWPNELIRYEPDDGTFTLFFDLGDDYVKVIDLMHRL